MRAEIARRYAEVSREQLLDSLNAVEWAPGVREGIMRLREASIEVLTVWNAPKVLAKY